MEKSEKKNKLLKSMLLCLLKVDVFHAMKKKCILLKYTRNEKNSAPLFNLLLNEHI